MIVCNRCGKENQNHYKFCLGCGAELTSAAPPAPAADPSVGMMKTMMADPHISTGGPAARPSGGQPGAMPGLSGGGFGGRSPAGPPPGVASPPPGVASPPPVQFSGPGYGPAVAGGGWPASGGPPGITGPMPPTPIGPAPLAQPPAVAAPHGGAAPGPQAQASPPGMLAGPAPGMRTCPSCGADVPINFKFCGVCGNSIEAARAAAPAAAPMPAPVAMAPASHALMTLIRPDGSEGGSFPLAPGENTIGRSHGAIFENDGYLSPTHAAIVVSGQSAVVRDLGSLNGVFVRMSAEEEIKPGQIVRLGQELLRFDAIEAPAPLDDGTEVMGSPNPGFWGKITVVIGNGVDGSAYPVLGDSITLGRERGDINFPDDGYVSGLHARLTLRAGKVYLADLGSSNGTFVKLQQERNLGHESFVLLGQQLFRLALR